MTQRTLVLFKPDAVRRGLVGTILARFEAKGLDIVAFEMRHVDAALADIWDWALTNWKIQPLQGLTAVRVDRIAANCLTVTPHLQ